jgi:predicted  nucleic acid-binding Zn-ribbon protein
MNTQNEHVKSMEAKIHSINNKIDMLQEKVEKLPSTVNSEFSSMVDDLKFKRTKLEDKLETFKGATDNAYADLQTGVEFALKDLYMAYDSAKERFEQEAS